MGSKHRPGESRSENREDRHLNPAAQHERQAQADRREADQVHRELFDQAEVG